MITFKISLENDDGDIVEEEHIQDVSIPNKVLDKIRPLLNRIPYKGKLIIEEVSATS